MNTCTEMDKTYKDLPSKTIKKMIEERQAQLQMLEHTEFNRRHRELALKLQGNLAKLEDALKRKEDGQT